MLPEIKVKIDADTTGLTKGLAAATEKLTKFGKVAGAAIGVSVVGAAAGLAALTKAAIDNADALDNMSQRIGVSVEALSRLQYAAKLSDTSIESLQTGFRTLANNMVAGSDAFAKLGISITNTDGSMRSSVEIFTEIADRFAGMENGALKSALAVDIFGRSGLDLIPLLNEGSAGLAKFNKQSDEVGNTISTKTAKAAAAFNNTLDQISLTIDGVVNKVMVAALPALQSLADKLASPEFAEAAANFGVAIVEQLSAIIEWLGKVEERWAQFVDFINTQGRPKVFPLSSTNIEDRTTPGWLDRKRAAGAMLDDTFSSLGGQTYDSPEAMFKAMSPPSGLGDGEGGGPTTGTNAIDALREQNDARLAVIGEGLAAVEELEQNHQDRLSAIRDAAQNRDLQSMGSFFGAVGSIMEQGGGQMLGIAKAFGAAQALINSYVAASQALADPTVPFWGKAAAFASMVATGLQAVSSIKGASPGGGGGAPTAASSGGVASSAMNRTLTVQGITPGQIFSGDAMRDFMERMLDMQRDGYQVVLA